MTDFDKNTPPDKQLSQWGHDPNKLNAEQLASLSGRFAKPAQPIFPSDQATTDEGKKVVAANNDLANVWANAIPDINGKTKFLPLTGSEEFDKKVQGWDKKLQEVNDASVGASPSDVKYRTSTLKGTGDNLTQFAETTKSLKGTTDSTGTLLTDLKSTYDGSYKSTAINTIGKDRSPKVGEFLTPFKEDSAKVQTEITNAANGGRSAFSGFQSTVDGYRESVAKVATSGKIFQDMADKSVGGGGLWSSGMHPIVGLDSIKTSISSAEAAGDKLDPKTAIVAGATKITDAGKATDGLWQKTISEAATANIAGNTVVTGSDKPSPGNPGTPSPGTRTPSPSSPSNPSPSSPGKGKPNDSVVDQITDKIMDAQNKNNPGGQPQQQTPQNQQPQQQSPQGQTPNLGQAAQGLTSPFKDLANLATQLSSDQNPNTDAARDALSPKPDEQHQRRTSQDARTADSMVAAGPAPQVGQDVRRTQLGADMRPLDKDGDGKMDSDAVSPTKENMDKDGDGKPDKVKTAVVIDGKMHPVMIDDPRLLEMMNSLGAADPMRKMDILEAAKLAGMPLSSYGSLLEDPLEAKTGDVIVGSQGNGMYLGDGNVLMEDGTVKRLGDVLELRPPDSGIFRLALPELPSEEGEGKGTDTPPGAPQGQNPPPGQRAPQGAGPAPAPQGDTGGAAPVSIANGVGEQGQERPAPEPAPQPQAPAAAPAPEPKPTAAPAAAPAPQVPAAEAPKPEQESSSTGIPTLQTGNVPRSF